MSYKCYEKVQIATDKFRNDGVPSGTLGIILDKYDNGDYEIQFLDNNGELSDIFFAVNELDIIKVKN